MKRKLLFVSYNHAKSNVADSVQNHRLIGALKDYYDIDILQRVQKRSDSGVWSPDIYILDRIIYNVFPFLISVFSLDRYWWSIKAYRTIKKSIGKYACIIMIYEPYTTRFLQYKIHKKSGSKVLSVLYDPYYDNIFFSSSCIGKKIRAMVEKRIVETSETIVVNNEKVLNLFKTRYEGKKIYKVDFCGFDESCIPESLHNHQSSLKTIVHCGNVFGERRIDEINEVVSKLKQRIDNLSLKLQILFVGTYCVNYEKVVSSNNQDVIKRIGAKYGDELSAILSRADGLLLIDPLNGNNCCLPSKLSEYYQYGKPIFAISAKGTPSYESLRESGQIVCDGENLKLMVDELDGFVNSNDYLTDSIDSFIRQKYAPQTIAKEYIRIINSI